MRYISNKVNESFLTIAVDGPVRNPIFISSFLAINLKNFLLGLAPSQTNAITYIIIIKHTCIYLKSKTNQILYLEVNFFQSAHNWCPVTPVTTEVHALLKKSWWELIYRPREGKLAYGNSIFMNSPLTIRVSMCVAMASHGSWTSALNFPSSTSSSLFTSPRFTIRGGYTLSCHIQGLPALSFRLQSRSHT